MSLITEPASGSGKREISRMVSVEEIEKNEFNLNLPRYIDSQTPDSPLNLIT
jgi:hypothetical protein